MFKRIEARIDIAQILANLQKEIRNDRHESKLQGTESHRYRHTLFKPILDSQEVNTGLLKQIVKSSSSTNAQKDDINLTKVSMNGDYRIGNHKIPLKVKNNGDIDLNHGEHVFPYTPGLFQLIMYDAPDSDVIVTTPDKNAYRRFLVESKYVWTKPGRVRRRNLTTKTNVDTVKGRLIEEVRKAAAIDNIRSETKSRRADSAADGKAPKKKSKKSGRTQQLRESALLQISTDGTSDDTETEGDGLDNNGRVVYVPTGKREAIKRLNLLLALHNAGNRGADDEATIIADYLRSQKFISKSRYAQIASLLYRDNVRETERR